MKTLTILPLVNSIVFIALFTVWRRNGPRCQRPLLTGGRCHAGKREKEPLRGRERRSCRRVAATPENGGRGHGGGGHGSRGSSAATARGSCAAELTGAADVEAGPPVRAGAAMAAGDPARPPRRWRRRLDSGRQRLGLKRRGLGKKARGQVVPSTRMRKSTRVISPFTTFSWF